VGAGPPVAMSPIRGDLVRWAREQRGLTIREVYLRGGPSIGYQSEVENGRKRDVHVSMLSKWLQILDVSERFVRGAYRPYHKEPALSRGLAGDITDELRALQASPTWSATSTQERLRKALHRLCNAREFSPLIVAYVLGLDLKALDDMLVGALAIPKEQVEAIATLTLLDPTDLLEGVSDRQILDAYGPIMRMALERGIPADQLQRWIEESA